MKLGLLLASSPERPELAAASQLATDSLCAGEEVYLYLIDDGVGTLDRPEIDHLRKKGVKLHVCAYGARKRHIPWDSEKAIFSGLAALADIICGCDRFLAFTPFGRSPETTVHRSFGSLPRTLITITQDPRESHYPAEAIRIGAGIGGWRKTEVNFLLHGPASRILAPDASQWVDGENYEHYLPIIHEWKRPFYLAPDAEKNAELRESGMDCRWCDAAALQELTQAAACRILL